MSAVDIAGALAVAGWSAWGMSVYHRLRRRVERVEAAAVQPIASTSETIDPAVAHATLKAIAAHGFIGCNHHSQAGCLEWCRAQALEALTKAKPEGT